jgi:hypothetical protein
VALARLGLDLVDGGVSADLRAVSASASDNVWFVGNAGTVLHWDGSAIIPQSTKLFSLIISMPDLYNSNIMPSFTKVLCLIRFVEVKN